MYVFRIHMNICLCIHHSVTEVQKHSWKSWILSSKHWSRLEREGEKWYFGGMYLYTCFQGFVYLKWGPKINTVKFSVMTKLVDRHMSGFYVILKAFLCI